MQVQDLLHSSLNIALLLLLSQQGTLWYLSQEHKFQGVEEEEEWQV
jgi:hypothetical protein